MAVLTIKNGGFPQKTGGSTIGHGDFTIEHGEFMNTNWWSNQPKLGFNPERQITINKPGLFENFGTTPK